MPVGDQTTICQRSMVILVFSPRVIVPQLSQNRTFAPIRIRDLGSRFADRAAGNRLSVPQWVFVGAAPNPRISIRAAELCDAGALLSRLDSQCLERP